MKEIEFKRPELEDKEIISSYFRKYPSRSCERTFVNVYLWSRHYKVKYAIIENALVFRSEDEGEFSFAYPAGAADDVKRAIEFLMGYCEEKGQKFSMYNVTPEFFAQFDAWYPGQYEIAYSRDDADYIYESEKLATLSGKKLHAKRNHINKFKAEHDNWAYEPITDENLEECFQMALKWRNENGCEDNPEKNAEMCVTLNSLRLYKELELTGGLLRLDGEVVAFTIGEAICEDTFVVHIEKAYAEVQGAYPMINQQFILHEAMDYQFINREEDLGEEGLRKAKLSYRPSELLEKGLLKYK